MGQVDFDQKEFKAIVKPTEGGSIKNTPTRTEGPAAAVIKFKKDFANINESTMRGFRKRYEKEIAQAKKDQRNTSTILPTRKQGRPLMLGKLDALVQRYTSAASNRGSVITRSFVTSTARALLDRYPDVVS